MEIVAISGQPRTELGKKGTRQARQAGQIPCVLYGGNEVFHFSTSINDIRPLVYTPDFKLASITIDGQSYQAILKDVQFHPVTDEVNHIDFLRLIEGHAIKVELPIQFRGVSPGVKSGGKLVQQVRRVKVKTTPEKLINVLHVDISSLRMGQSIRIRDIDAADGIEILNQPGTPIATVEIPRAMRSATAAAERAAEEMGETAEAGAED